VAAVDCRKVQGEAETVIGKVTFKVAR